MHLTSHITHSNGYAPCIAYYRSNGVDQLFRKLKPKPKLNPPNAHRSPIKICEKWHTHNVQFPFMPNAFRILKPIQKSSKRVWVFHNTGANAFAKNQMRLAYEDKRDLYCTTMSWKPMLFTVMLVALSLSSLPLSIQTDTFTSIWSEQFTQFSINCHQMYVCPANILVFYLSAMEEISIWNVYRILVALYSIHKNWSIEKFHIFFIDTSYDNLSEQRNYVTKKKYIWL